VIREEEPNPELFEYIFNAIQILDLKDSYFANIHLLFLIQLSRFLGFFPKDNYSATNPNFDLQEGEFSNAIGLESMIAVEPYSKYISLLCNTSFENLENIQIHSSHKNQLLEIILTFYRLHLPGITEFKSFEVLKSVFGD
jgi:DNA repair protein RecO (recombination protein O)